MSECDIRAALPASRCAHAGYGVSGASQCSSILGNLLALLRRLWYEQIMNKPAQLALAHRPTAQLGPHFDGPSWTADRQNEPEENPFWQNEPKRMASGCTIPSRNHFDIFRKRSQVPQTKPTGKT
jgi:hypothetical protein